MAYAKLSTSILTSSIWSESDSTRLVWITLLAMADQHGEIQCSLPGLANMARVPLEAAKEAIEKFLAPDPYSRTTENEGRRLEVIEGGWLLLNHAKYRERDSLEDRRQKAAARQRRFRERKALPDFDGDRQPSVTPALHVTLRPDIADADADADAEPPPSPQGGDGGELLTLTEDQRTKPVAPSAASRETDLKVEIGSWLHRRAITPWSAREIARLRDLIRNGSVTDEAVELLRWYYLESQSPYVRKDVLTLLNNWQGECDRARRLRGDGGFIGQAETIEKAIERHPANLEWVGSRPETITDAQRAELRSLKLQLAKLRGVR